MEEEGNSLIERMLPFELIGRVFDGLPPSYRFLAPVSRRFRDDCERHAGGNRSTFLYGISSPGQLGLYGGAISAEIVDDAAGSGRLEFLKSVRARGIGMNYYSIFCAAAEGGHRDVVKWAHAQDVGPFGGE